MRTDDDALLEMTAKERALMAEKRKEADISEKQATDATAHPPVKEIAVSADREGVPALVREEAYPTSAKSRSQSLVSPTSEYSNAMQLPLDLPHVSPTRNNTLSSFTEDDTDWGEDEITGSLQDLHFADFSAFSQESLFSQDQMNETLMRPVFSPMKEELIDRIMKEFWAIFDQESGTILGNPSPGTGSMDADENLNDNKQTASEGGEDSTQNTGSNSFSTTNNNSQKYPRSVLGRHSREGEDDDQDNGDGRSPKKPKTFVSPCQTQDGNTKFACPYRKRDPRKYCVQHWRSCALTPLDTVARVKAHLYKYHRIFPCQRCQKLFKDPDAVTLHAQTPEGCEVRHIEHTDGVTPKIAEKLRSKKKARDQTEAERWRDIYELLFPNEMTPSPYFETVQEDTALSPDSRQLADYDEYYRRELPRAVRAALEESIQNQSQPIEENLRNRFMDIVRDCQDLISTRYRSSGGRATATPSINPTSPDFPMISMRETRNDMSLTANGTAELSFGRITPPFFHPPSPQSHLRSRLEVSDLQNNASKAPDGKDPSDSGYSSNTSGLQSRHPSSFHNTIDSASLSTSQSHVASSESFSANAESTWNLDDGLFGMNPDNDVMNEDDTSAFNQSWADFKAQSAEGNAWNLYMSNSENLIIHMFQRHDFGRGLVGMDKGEWRVKGRLLWNWVISEWGKSERLQHNIV
ncbi:uncharacterized protein K444DRAFT_274932 [Hyaloscypha bicolor E]|uniref:C2H2-type domain-containing protein n=1 Tax=Hyaloscypha bicolor E TaxID=1095630 RepID=A0A2J6SIT7_9HELO|nr:uncharacterized protein K444DRAFT_274932 [Hyaloscypha bicolor E]PMD50679.1 hypothetical protein K444DRAFT_274932 [Hyaloscypha bicolor E]